RRHGDFAIAGAVAGVQLGPGGEIERSAISLFGLAVTPIRADAAEAALTGANPGDVSAEEVGRLAVSGAGEPPGDLHAPPGYRLRVGAAMAGRAWSQAVEMAQSA